MGDLSEWPPPPSFQRTRIDLSRLKTDDAFRSISVALAHEMSQWLVQASLLMPHPECGWRGEPEALLCAHVARLSKMLGRMAKALATLDEEAALIFCRCAFETVVNFHYLRTPNGDETQVAERMHLFKMAGYRPELKIRKNLRGRTVGGGPSLDELDTAALKELDAYWKAEAMPDKVQDLPGMADRLSLADMNPLAEIYYFAIPSQAIHGTYQNLAKFHVQQGEAEGTVAPRYQADEINATVFQAVVEMSLTVLDHWLLVVHPGVQHRWRDALVELRERLATVHDALAAFYREME